MKTHLPSSKPVLRTHNRPAFWSSSDVLFGTAILCLLAIVPGGWTQYPVTLQAPALIGPTTGEDLRNATAATLTGAGIVRNAADTWGRRARSGTYRIEQFQQDYANMQMQFQTLRQQFNWMSSIALPLGRPGANNSIAELDAGLNIISELFPFLLGQYNAGTLDRQTLVRTCQALEDAMRDWERELRKNTSRMGLVW